MKRRKFLQLSALSSASSLLLNGHTASAFSKTALLNGIPESIIEGRSLVMIQLLGGNDGLNTLIPLNQYDKYANLRPTVKIKNAGVNGAIPLDSTLPLEDQILIHPSLIGFKSLYDAGKLNIIQSVGYPEPTKSHFAARALMFKGGDGTPENANKNSGWMARFLHSGYNIDDFEDPLGIQLGSRKPSLGFLSQHEHKVDVNLTGQNVSGYYNVISNIGNPKPTDIPDSEYGDNIDFIANTEVSTNAYSERISEVFDAGSNSNVNYPDYKLADQLKTVARMIKGGSKTKIFLVSLGGFDTHASQVLSTSESHKGKHADLLKELGDSVKAFQEDIEALGIDQKIVSATFTEFGRKPKENGNLGTDHGNLGPMFVIGTHVNGGVSGTNLNLSGVTKHFDETKMQFDYRQVFSTIISDFLGASTDVVNGTEFSDYDGSNKIDLIGDAHKADGNLGIPLMQDEEASLYPNPVDDACTLKFDAREMYRGHIVLYNLQGGIAFQLQQDFTPGVNIIPLSLSHLSEGVYILAVKDNYNNTLKSIKLIKR